MAEAVKEEPEDYDETAASVVPEYVSIPDSFNEDEDSKCDINLGEISSTDTDEKVDIKHDSEYYQQFLDKEPWDAGEGTSKQPDGDVKPSGLVESIKEEFDSENSDMEDENGEDNEDSKSLFEEQLHDVKDADSDEDGEQKRDNLSWFKKRIATRNSPRRTQHHKCKICDFLADTKVALQRHAKNAHTTRTACKMCDFVTISADRMEKHLRKCNFCDYSACLYTVKYLEQHIANAHEDQKNLKCNQCDFRAFEKLEIASHVDRFHNKDNKCGLCSYKASNKNQLLKHLNCFHKVKKFQCESCESYSANSASTLKRHMDFCKRRSK